MSLMIKNAHAILSGLPGEAARLAGPDIRIRDGKIAAIGSCRKSDRSMPATV